MTELLRYDFGSWSIDVPSTWLRTVTQNGVQYFEAPDKLKGIYAALMTIPADKAANGPQVLADLQEIEVQTLFTPPDTWTILHKTAQQFGADQIGFIEGLNQEASYFITARQIVCGTQALLANCHDYQCLDVVASGTFFAPIMHALAVR